MIVSATFFAPTRADWSAWLEANHASTPEIWLVTYMKRAGKPSASYNDAVEEALCFGWIDSIPYRASRIEHPVSSTQHPISSPGA